MLEPAVTSFKELCQQFSVIDGQKIHDHCDELELKWRKVETVLPQRVQVVRKEINTWREFNEELEKLQSWLENVKKMCEEWKSQENSSVMVQNLEVSLGNLYSFYRNTVTCNSFIILGN